MESDSVALRSRVCMIFRLMESVHEHHVYLVDIDESFFKIPPPCPDYSVGFADMDLSVFEEKTPDIVLVAFPLINVCALDSLLCFFPIDPSMDVFYLEVPKSLNKAVYGEDGGVMKKCRFNPRRVVYGDGEDCLKKAPLNLVSPKDLPHAIRYGTRFLVFSTTIRVGISPDSPGEQFEIYHPFSESALKDLPNLVIHRNSSGDGYVFYNLATKLFEPLFEAKPEAGLIRFTFLSFSLIGDVFVVRTELGMFCLDLLNPTAEGWVDFLDGNSLAPWQGVAEVHVAQNGFKLEGTLVYRSEVDEEELAMSRSLPCSISPFQVRNPWKYCGWAVALFDGCFNYPCSTSCVLHVQRQYGLGIGTYLILDVIRAHLSRFENENDKEWAQIIHSFRFRTKTKSYCCRMLLI